jgi:hypothetical protein
LIVHVALDSIDLLLGINKGGVVCGRARGQRSIGYGRGSEEGDARWDASFVRCRTLQPTILSILTALDPDDSGAGRTVIRAGVDAG